MRRFFTNFSIIWKILSLVFILSACSNGYEEEMQWDIDDQHPDERSENVVIISTENDLVLWRLYAAEIRRYYDSNKTFADSVYVEMYNEDGSISSTLRSDHGEVDETTNIMIGTGNVVVESENGILKTPYLIWDQNTDQVQAKEHVTLIREENILYGDELWSDMTLHSVEITNVRAEGEISEEDIDW
jgi:LPS export ABC transporter protein LptC